MTEENRLLGVTPGETAVITFQLRRPPRDLTGIAARCPFGHPAVIETAPVLSDGTPNPTLLYVSCPTLAAAISRVEAGRGVRALKAAWAEDSGVRTCLAEVTERYRTRRRRLAAGRSEGAAHPAAGARRDAGIGGPESPEQASCLHAYAAALLAVLSGWLAAEDALLTEVQSVWPRLLPDLAASWCLDGRCSGALASARRAVIDVGTISVRLLVADVALGRVEDIERRAVITRLGDGLRLGGPLSSAAATRTAETVISLVEEARRLGAASVVLAGTSAVREARDGADFLESLGRLVEARAVVLSGQEEAEFGYVGVSLDIPGEPLVIDIGGGSTELSRRIGIRLETESLDLGASKATGRWLHHDPPLEEELAGAKSSAVALLGPLRHRFLRKISEAGTTPAAADSERAVPRLVGVAGTVTTIACLAAGLDAYDRDAIHLRTVSADEVREQLERLSTLTVDQRAALPCVQAGRAPVIVGGAVVLLAAVEVLGFPELTVSERDLLDGLALRGAC